MAITRMTLHYGPPPRPKPREGDRRVIRGVMHVRRQEILNDPIYGRCYHVRRGRPVFEWVSEDEVKPPRTRL